MAKGLLSRPIFASLGLLLCLVVPASGWAQSRPPVPARGVQPARSGQRVDIQVKVVHATNADSAVDAELTSLVHQLRLISYTGFHLLRSEHQSLAIRQEATFKIAGGRRVQIMLLDRNEREAKIRFRIFEADEKKLDTTVNIHRNKSFIVAGPKFEDGILILPVSAMY